LGNLERESKEEKTAGVMLKDLTRDATSRNNGIIVITGAAWREREREGERETIKR